MITRLSVICLVKLYPIILMIEKLGWIHGEIISESNSQ